MTASSRKEAAGVKTYQYSNRWIRFQQKKKKTFGQSMPKGRPTESSKLS